MEERDHLTALATSLLVAIGSRDKARIEAGIQACRRALAPSEDERGELLALLADSAAERLAGGEAGLPPSQWRLLVHLAA